MVIVAALPIAISAPSIRVPHEAPHTDPASQHTSEADSRNRDGFARMAATSRGSREGHRVGRAGWVRTVFRPTRTLVALAAASRASFHAGYARRCVVAAALPPALDSTCEGHVLQALLQHTSRALIRSAHTTHPHLASPPNPPSPPLPSSKHTCTSPATPSGRNQASPPRPPCPAPPPHPAGFVQNTYSSRPSSSSHLAPRT